MVSRVGGPVYDRVPSCQLRGLLVSGGFLAPLLQERTVAGVRLDVHLRRGDEVDLCCGLTCLVKSREYQNPWGQSSRHRRLERPNADPERLFDFQTEDGFAV